MANLMMNSREICFLRMCMLRVDLFVVSLVIATYVTFCAKVVANMCTFVNLDIVFLFIRGRLCSRLDGLGTVHHGTHGNHMKI